MTEHENSKLVCGVYTRVSSPDQVENGYSLEEQKEILLQRAEKQGYEVYDVYTDAGISGKDVKHRPQMQRLLRDVQEGRVQVILAWKLSRTFRSLKDELDAMEIMKANGAFFDFASEGVINPASGVGKLHLQILGMVSEMERENIADNVYMGMCAAARQGQWMGGSVSYGYDRKCDTDGKKGVNYLVVNEAEALVVRKIFHMFVEEQVGYKGIANTLNKQGVRTKKNKEFSIGTIRGIITNPVYCGYVCWGKHRKWSELRRKGTVANPIIAKGVHESIISEELFRRAETIRLAKGGKSTRKYECLNILTGILKCPECGAGMVLSRAGAKGRKITYYACGKWHNKGTVACHSNLVVLDSINEEVLSRIANLCNDEVIIRKVLRKLNKAHSDEIEGNELNKADVERLLKQIQRDIQQLQERFEADDCNMDVQVYKQRIRELRANEELCKTRLADLKVSIGQSASEHLYTIEEVREVFKNLKEVLKRSDVVELRALMHLMIEKITLDPETRSLDKIHIKINPALTDYLGVSIEEEASKKASSFSCVNRKVLKFVI